MDALELIRKPIEDDLKDYVSLFEADFSSENPLLHTALQHILKRPGKRLRPIMALLSARITGQVSNLVLHASVGLELLHTASLVHDDIVDESDMRRGQQSLNKFLNAQSSVLVGDYLLSRALLHSSYTDNIQVVIRLSLLGQSLANGELLQLYNTDSETIDEDSYYEVLRHKTASLFAAAGEIGSMLSGATKEQTEALRSYGENLGMCFQIRDDIFDYYSAKKIGKPTGNDMMEGKLTLPIIYAINTTDNDEMRALAIKVRQRLASLEEIAKLQSFAIENGGIEYAKTKMKTFADQAINVLNIFPDSPYKESLLLFAKFVVERDF